MLKSLARKPINLKASVSVGSCTKVYGLGFSLLHYHERGELRLVKKLLSSWIAGRRLNWSPRGKGRTIVLVVLVVLVIAVVVVARNQVP